MGTSSCPARVHPETKTRSYDASGHCAPAAQHLNFDILTEVDATRSFQRALSQSTCSCLHAKRWRRGSSQGAVDGRILILSDHLHPMGTSDAEFVLPQYLEVTQKRDPGSGASGRIAATYRTSCLPIENKRSGHPCAPCPNKLLVPSRRSIVTNLWCACRPAIVAFRSTAEI
jgi:hypothetical protein